MSERPRNIDHLLYGDAHDEPRPKTRSECADGPRPCPFASCRYHLSLDVTDTNKIHAYFPGYVAVGDFDNLPATCALDVADEGTHTLDEVGQMLNMSRERIRQIEASAMLKLKLRIVY